VAGWSFEAAPGSLISVPLRAQEIPATIQASSRLASLGGPDWDWNEFRVVEKRNSKETPVFMKKLSP
jgi:hypothetical protein